MHSIPPSCRVTAYLLLVDKSARDYSHLHFDFHMEQATIYSFSCCLPSVPQALFSFVPLYQLMTAFAVMVSHNFDIQFNVCMPNYNSLLPLPLPYKIQHVMQINGTSQDSLGA